MSSRETPTYLGQPVAAWVKMLRSTNPLLRRTAAYALGMMGPDASEASKQLMAALEDEWSLVRVWAASALALVDGKRMKTAVAALVESLKDEHHFVRSLAAWHLGRLGCGTIGVREAIPKLRALLSDADPNVRREAIEAMKRLQSRRK